MEFPVPITLIQSGQTNKHTNTQQSRFNNIDTSQVGIKSLFPLNCHFGPLWDSISANNLYVYLISLKIYLFCISKDLC